jgi:hypothetical protein
MKKRWLYNPANGELFEKNWLTWSIPYQNNAPTYATIFADTEEEALRIIAERFEDKPREPTEYEKDLKERVDKALEIIYNYGQIDGDHHKTWVIDQVVRALTAEAYDKWISDYQMADSEEDYLEGNYYEWDEGVAP